MAILARWYAELAVLVGRPTGATPMLAPPAVEANIAIGAERSREAVWLCEHLDHLLEHLSELIAPATHVAETRRQRWWQ